MLNILLSKSVVEHITKLPAPVGQAAVTGERAAPITAGDQQVTKRLGQFCSDASNRTVSLERRLGQSASTCEAI